jgi:hypothetical protein
MVTRTHEQQVSEERLEAATGRTRAQWYALLDAAGAQEWDHTRIARWLGGEHDVDGWWAQGVTVGYEQSRGLREPGQRSDGSFEASTTKTLYGTREELWPHLADDDLRSDWLDVDWPVMGVTEPRSVRFRADDDSHVTMLLEPVPPGKDGRAKVRLAVQHTKLPHAGAVAETKKFWKDSLTTLAAAVNQA